MLATEDHPSRVRRISISPSVPLVDIRRAFIDSGLKLEEFADLIHQNGYRKVPDVSNLSKYLRGALTMPPKMVRHVEEVLKLRDKP